MTCFQWHHYIFNSLNSSNSMTIMEKLGCFKPWWICSTCQFAKLIYLFIANTNLVYRKTWLNSFVEFRQKTVSDMEYFARKTSKCKEQRLFYSLINFWWRKFKEISILPTCTKVISASETAQLREYVGNFINSIFIGKVKFSPEYLNSFLCYFRTFAKIAFEIL